MILVSEALSQPEQNTNFTYKASPDFTALPNRPKPRQIYTIPKAAPSIEEFLFCKDCCFSSKELLCRLARSSFSYLAKSSSNTASSSLLRLCFISAFSPRASISSSFLAFNFSWIFCSFICDKNPAAPSSVSLFLKPSTSGSLVVFIALVATLSSLSKSPS